MTDISSVKAHAETQPASVALYAGPPPPAFTNGSPALDGTIEEEESSTIKCICGFQDDDGNTVLCEKCDTWQHIVCYYESPQHVPDVHECTDCYPRAVDSKSAAEKQRQRRELHNLGERKGKPKTTTKNQKKRTKDPLGSVQPNGWAVHSNSDLHYGSERKSGSPRDQPPPSKRPKTSHRTSGSISQAPSLAPGSRKRASSTLQNGHSPVKSPTHLDGLSAEEYSPEFMSLYRQPDPPLTDSNSYTDLRIANDISLWLNDRDALSEATGGMEPGQVFQRIDQTIEDMDAFAPVIVKQTEEDPRITAHGLRPQWQFLIAESPVPAGAYIGELKGQIGRKEDYFSDPSNRWDLLRHPEPFVFFPPHLPIYIDMRQQGTLLRYTRRSCNPNMAMKILTQSPESGYHFCFVAVDEIHPGDELTIGWEIDSEIRQRLNAAVTNGDIRKEGFKKIEPWIATVLANFGGCACDTRTRECLLERARRPNNAHTDAVQPLKTKAKRTKKTQVSPLSTGQATNSRAGSEAFNHDGPDDENNDSRSTSGSHSKPSSRDITPATHFSVDGGDVKMSDRERRKLQQSERLFEQMDHDAQHKGKRGKRNSAGSTLNTPSLSSKPLGPPEPSPSARNHREHSNGVARKTSGSSTKADGRAASKPKPKPVYVDSCTQTDTDGDVKPVLLPVLPAKKREVKPIMSFKRKLLQQALEDRLQRERNRSASVKQEAKSPALRDAASNKASPAPQSVPPADPSPVDTMVVDTVESGAKEPTKEPTPPPKEDVEMKDAEQVTCTKPTIPKVEEMPDALNPEPSPGTSHLPIQPPPPPLPAELPAAEPSPQPANDPVPVSQKPGNLQVQLPSTPDLSNPSPTNITVVTPGSAATPCPNTQSPVSVSQALSPFSPSVASSVNPGPPRKKLSLSDYTSRKAKMASAAHSTPPLAQMQTVSSPTLSTSSLPNQNSPPTKSAEPEKLPTVAEEPKPVSPA